MITIKSPREIEDMAKSGAILAGMHIALEILLNQEFLAGRLKNFVKTILKATARFQNKLALKAINTQPVSASMMKFATVFPARIWF